MWKFVWSCVLLVWLLWSCPTEAGELSGRLAEFPHWEGNPITTIAKEDLVYPEWLAGTWNVTSSLEALVAPFAPTIVTPGFESNRQYLHQPITFQVRFIKVSGLPAYPLRRASDSFSSVIADRAFNGLNLAIAYLGPENVLSVKVDPDSPNRQITSLKGDRRLVTVITHRATESPEASHFITAEFYQQIFRGLPQLYFNQVETTTAYQWQSENSIRADQITAIYLSPQDADYFKAGNHPVALYRYSLALSRAINQSSQKLDN